MSYHMSRLLLSGLVTLSLIDPLNAAAISNPADEYFSVTCDTPPIKDTGADPKARWEAAKAEGAWVAAARNWNENEGSMGSATKLNFVNSILNLWGQGDTVNCGLVEGSCDFSALQCGDQKTPGSSHVPHPGAWMIMKSLSHIHAYYLNIFNSFGAAGNSLGRTMASFVDTFSPQKEEQLVEKFFKGLEEATFNLIISGALGPYLDQIGEKIGEEVFGEIKDQIIDSAKDAVKEGLASGDLPEQSQAEKQSTLLDTFEAVIRVHQKVLNDYVNNLLSGDVTHLSALHNAIQDGKWLIDILGAQSAYDLSGQATQAFAALLVPEAWKLSQLQPMILMEEKDCDIGNPLTLMNNEATHSGGSCAVAGKTFFLVGFSNFQCERGSFGNFGGGNFACETDVFQKLPGIEKLPDYGFDKDNMIRSVYQAYQNNGNKNGAPLDPSGGDGTIPFAQGMDTPGLYPGIPICEINTAAKTWKDSPDAIGEAAALCP